jgi:hypothetical protein
MEDEIKEQHRPIFKEQSITLADSFVYNHWNFQNGRNSQNIET